MRVARLAAVLVTALSLAFAAAALAQDSGDQDLEELLQQVGQAYAAGYLGPGVTALSACQNGALFHTAAIPWDRPTFGFGLKAMAVPVADEDRVFSRRLEVADLGDYFPDVPSLQGQGGTLVIAGPTAFGDTGRTGTMTALVGGVEVAQAEGIEGLVDTDWLPLATPEAWFGGLMGARLNVRWLPSFGAGDYGKVNFFGWGLQWSPNGIFPLLPLDVMVGYFHQDLDVGSVLETNAHSVFLAGSRRFGLATVYGGVAREKGTVAVSYVETATQQKVDFEMESKMKSRLTVGATLSLGAKLNAEVAFGEVTVTSAGLLFGL